MRHILPKVGQWATYVATAFLGVVLAVALFTLISRSPGHQDLYDRQGVIEQQLQYVSCLLLIPERPPTPEAVAACQVTPDTVPED